MGSRLENPCHLQRENDLMKPEKHDGKLRLRGQTVLTRDW